jgi:hypothetical protein
MLYRDLQQALFRELLPEFERKWHSRNQRPLPASIQLAGKSGCNRAEVSSACVAPRIGVVIDLVTRLPVEIWF